MQGFDIYGVQNGGYHGGEYPKGDGNGRSSDVSTSPKGDFGTRWEYSTGSWACWVGNYQNKIPQLNRVLAVVRELCAIGKEWKVAEGGRQAFERTRGVRMVVYNLGEKGIQIVRMILASFGIFAANAMMDIPPEEGHSRHTGDCRSDDGKTEYKASAHCTIWVFEDQASHRNITYEIDPLGAWEKIADSPRVVKFLGGESCKPGPNIGVIQIVLGRAAVGGDGNIPKFPATYMELDLGIVPGAQQSTDPRRFRIGSRTK
jgi:hypothetical protein